MKIEINVSKDRQTFTISVDDSPPIKMDNFILLTKEGDQTRNLVFGSPENVGRLLYGLYANCWKLGEASMRDVLELVADDISDVRRKLEEITSETIRRVM